MVVALAGLTAGASSAREAFNPNGVKIFAVEGVSFSGTVANFTDPGPKSTYTAIIHWGDGTDSEGTLVSTGKDNANDVTGKHTYIEEGTYELRIRITGGSGSGEATPTAQVSDAPLTAKVNVPPVAESSVLNTAIATFTDLDPNDNASEYTVTIDWGDGATSPGQVTRTGAGAFTVGGNHAYADEGPRTVGVTVRDAGGSTVTATQAITVVDAALTADAPLTRRGTEGRPLAAGAVASFHDANSGATAADYTGATINWGDRTASAGTISPAPGGGWQVVGAHTYREEGRYATSVVVNDRGGATMTANGASIIADAPLRAFGQRLTAAAGKAFRGVVATFTDAAGRSARLSDFRATINWGDGRSTRGTISTGSGRFAVRGTHTYSRAGPRSVTVLIHDRGGSNARATSRLSVSAP